MRLEMWTLVTVLTVISVALPGDSHCKLTYVYSYPGVLAGAGYFYSVHDSFMD